MEQYFSATHRMEQEVMFPSLLRGVFPQQQQQQQEQHQEQDGAAAGADGHTDLYERYQQLKAIKPMVEKGLACVHEQSSSSTDEDACWDEAGGGSGDARLEQRLCHHLSGLQQVLSHLTRDTNALTRRYSQILEQISPSEGQPSW